MPTQKITLGHSPDSDDAFMFFGLATGAVDPGPFRFEHILRDIQTLNEWARQEKLDITAVSVHAYAYLYEKYAILSSGASMGATELAAYQYDPGQQSSSALANSPSPPTGVHGPLLIAAEPVTLAQVAAKTIAVPGTMTSAFLALRLALGDFPFRVMNFDDILPAVENRTVAAGLIIHEGQLTFQHHHLHCLLDLGRWWFEQTQLPLPLGCNIIRRSLGPAALARISVILKASIQYALDHRPEALEYALQFGRGLDRPLADRFVGLYVNQWTLDYGPVGRMAVTQFLQRAHAAHLIPEVPSLDFV